MLRRRAAEFLGLLRLIDRQAPAGLDPHLILDDYAAPKTEAVKRWPARHPRFHVHVTPASASRINAVEVLFATLTKRRLKRGVLRSVIELNQAIRAYLAAPKPFRWAEHHHRQAPALGTSAGSTPLGRAGHGRIPLRAGRHLSRVESSFSAALSSIACASRFLSLAFSCPGVRTRLALVSSSPPNLACSLEKAAPLLP